MKNKWFFFLRLIIGLVTLGIVLFNIGLKSVLVNTTKINLYYLPLFILIHILMLYSGCLNIKILTLPYKKNIHVFEAFKYYSLSWVLSLIIPGRIGEFSLIYFLKKKEISIGQSSAIVVLDKFISLAIISILAIIGFFRFFTATQGIRMVVIMLFLVSMLVFLVVSNIGRGIIKRFILRSFSGKFEGFSKSLFEYFKKFKKELILNLFLTIIKFLLSGLLIYLFFLAFSQFSVSYFNTLLIYCIMVIISIIPISLNGLGLKEGAAIYLFSRLGINKIIVGSIFINILIFNYILAIVTWFLFFNKKTMANFKSTQTPNSIQKTNL